MEEIWKTLEENKNYEISNLGRIRVIGTDFYPSYKIHTRGYFYINLRKQYLVHRLVAKYFVYNPCPGEYTYVNHKDENKQNNIASNLEWCTNKYNLNYSNVGEKNSINLSKGKIIRYDEFGNIIDTYNSLEFVGRTFGWNIKSAIKNNTTNRYFLNSFWFKETEEFDFTRRKDFNPIYKLINIYTETVIVIGTLQECAKALNVPKYIIQNAVRRNGLINKTFKIVKYND